MNEEYIDNVKELIKQKESEKIKEIITDLHPADIAELCNELSPEEARSVYLLLDNETAADVLVEMDEDVRNNPAVYPEQAVLDKLFVSKPLPGNVQRIKTRSWTRFKSGK